MNNTTSKQLPREIEEKFDERFIQKDKWGVMVGGNETFPYTRIKEFLAQELHTIEQKHERLLRAAVDALKSYRYGNSSLELADEVIQALQKELTNTKTKEQNV